MNQKYLSGLGNYLNQKFYMNQISPHRILENLSPEDEILYKNIKNMLTVYLKAGGTTRNILPRGY